MSRIIEWRTAMKIIDLKCTIVEGYPLVRIDTDEGISGFAQIEFPKRSYVKQHILFFKPTIIGLGSNERRASTRAHTTVWCI